MNATEIKQKIEIYAEESAEQQVEDYLNGDRFELNETDIILKNLMKDPKIKNKVLCFSDVLWNNENFLKDNLGNFIYQLDSNEAKMNLLEDLSGRSNTNAWNNVLVKIKKELKNA